MNDEMLEQIMSSIVQLMARCDACELALRVVADRNGIGAEKMEKLIQRLTKLSTQGPLQQAETFDPGLAARIDWRSPPDKLPDPWLFDSEALLNELDRCRELVLNIPITTQTPLILGRGTRLPNTQTAEHALWQHIRQLQAQRTRQKRAPLLPAAKPPATNAPHRLEHPSLFPRG